MRWLIIFTLYFLEFLGKETLGLLIILLGNFLIRYLILSLSIGLGFCKDPPLACVLTTEKDKTCVCLLATKNKTQVSVFFYKILLVQAKETNLTPEVLCEWRHLEEKFGSRDFLYSLCAVVVIRNLMCDRICFCGFKRPFGDGKSFKNPRWHRESWRVSKETRAEKRLSWVSLYIASLFS